MTGTLRRLLGRAVEWALAYEHEVRVSPVARGPRDPKLPFHKYGGDAGYDLYSVEDVGIPAGCTRDVRSGIAVDPRERIWLEIKARSSTMTKLGLEVVDAVIDRGYRGEMCAQVHNPTGCQVIVRAGDRVAQLVPHRLIPLRFRFGPLSPSDRMTSGFGSSGR